LAVVGEGVGEVLFPTGGLAWEPGFTGCICTPGPREMATTATMTTAITKRTA